MANQLFTNNAESTLATVTATPGGALSLGGTTIVLAASEGSKFPSPSAGDFFLLTLYELDVGGLEITYEVVKCTARTGDTLTVVRDFEGIVVAAGGTSGGWAYPSGGGNPTHIVHASLRWTAWGAAETLQKQDNLASLTSASTARTSLGLGSMATQAASSVAITGGTISGVTLTEVDSTTSFKDNADDTKVMKFELSSITTGNTRTMTVPDTDIKLAGHASGFTASRIPYATGATGGLLTDSADLTFDGSDFKIGSTKFTVAKASGNTIVGGTLGVTGVTSLAAGGVSAPGLYLSTDTGTGFYRIGPNNYGFAVSGTKLLDFAATVLGLVGALNLTTASALALTVGVNGTTNPAFTIDASTASQVAGLKITGAVTGGTVALIATDSGANASISFNAKGTGTMGLNTSATGLTTVGNGTGGVTLAGHSTIEGVTSTGATGTGKLVFDTAPVLGAFTSGTQNITAASTTAFTVGINGVTGPTLTIDTSTGSAVAGIKITGATTGGTVAIVATDTGSNANITFAAKGTGTFGLNTSATGLTTIGNGTGGVSLAGHCAVEGVTSTGATGTGKFVFDTAPTLGVTTVTSINKWGFTAPTTACTMITGADSCTYTMPASTDTIAGLAQAQSFSKAQRGAFVTLTDAAPTTWDLSLANQYNWVMGGSRTLSTPTNIVEGQQGVLKIRQDATGSRVATWPWCFEWAGGTAGVLSTPGCTMDQLVYSVDKYASATVSCTSATPCVVTWTTHGLVTGQRVQFTGGTQPTGFSLNTSYWWIRNDADSGWLASSLVNAAAGTKMASSSTGTSPVLTAISIAVALNKALA